LPYVGSIFSRISGVLSRHKITSVCLPPRKMSGFLRSVKNDLALKMLGVYSIPCECGQAYIGQTDRPFDWHQVEGAPAIYPSRTSEQVSRSEA
jgi:hypothetical protein